MCYPEVAVTLRATLRTDRVLRAFLCVALAVSISAQSATRSNVAADQDRSTSILAVASHHSGVQFSRGNPQFENSRHPGGSNVSLIFPPIRREVFGSEYQLVADVAASTARKSFCRNQSGRAPPREIS